MLDEGRSSQPEEPGAPLGNILTMQRNESCNVFPSYRWETEADCDHVLQECDSDLYEVSGAQLGIKIRNYVLCLCSGGGGGDELTANISRQTVEWISTKEDADLGSSAASRKEGGVWLGSWWRNRCREGFLIALLSSCFEPSAPQ